MQKIDIHTHNYIENADHLQIYIYDYLNDKEIKTCPTCFGIHPWFIERLDIKKTLKHIKDSLSHDSFFAFGEIGLDRSIETPLKKQIDILEEQLDIIEQNRIKKIIIHNVRTSFDLIPILNNFKLNSKILLHDYNDNYKIFKAFEKKFDCYISTGKNLFSRANISKDITKFPIERVFLETDDQTQYNIDDIYSKCASLMNLSEKEITKRMFENYKNFNS